MTKVRLRFWLLTGLNLLAGSAVLFLTFDELQATRGLIDDGIGVLLIFASFVLVPLVSLTIYVLGRKLEPSRTPGLKIYRRISLGFLTLCWLAITAPALSWGALIIAAKEPWPLSLTQGPDTERAKTGVEKLFGEGPAQAMSSVYFISFNVRDGSYFVRFDYRDSSVIEQIAETKDMVKVALSARDDNRFDLRAYRDRMSWWIPDDINRSDVLYVDRKTGEKIAGTLPRNEPIGSARVMWVHETTRTAHYREIEF